MCFASRVRSVSEARSGAGLSGEGNSKRLPFNQRVPVSSSMCFANPNKRSHAAFGADEESVKH